LLGLREINLREEYRSDVNDIVAEFFLPCLGNCVEYNRCVDFLSIHTLSTIAMGFDKFAEGEAKLRMITGPKFRASEVILLTRLFSEKYKKSLNEKSIKNFKINNIKNIIDNGQVELKIAIPNSDQVSDSFSERIGIFKDEQNNVVAFTGTSNGTVASQSRDFESVDVFTSWNDKTRVERKISDFEDLWKNKTNYVEVYDFMDADKKGLLKYSPEWIMQD